MSLFFLIITSYYNNNSFFKLFSYILIGMSGMTVYSSPLDVINKVAKSEGLKGFYKGI
jgi:hypothetical protein